MAEPDPSDDYLNFELSIWAEGSQYFAKVIDSPVGSSAPVPLPPLFEDPEKAAMARLRVENALLRRSAQVRGPVTAEEKILQEFGQRVFDVVFRQTPDIAIQYANSQARVAENPDRIKGLRLKLRIEEPGIAQLPWEYLYNSKEKEWLALHHRSPIVRYLAAPQPQTALTIDGPLNILGMIANPGGEWATIDAERERDRIDRAIEPHHKEGRINFCWVPGETQEHLLNMMGKASWHVFHFIGHGGLDEPEAGAGPASTEPPEGFVVFSDGKCGASEVPASDLKVLLDSAGSLRVVVLNCCEGARGTAADSFASPAAALVRFGIPAVVAMQFPISDEAAINLAGAFYDRLADNWPLERALTHARKMMQQKSRTEWGIPVLFTRSNTGRLFSGVHAGTPPVTPSDTTSRDTHPPSQVTDARRRLRALFGV
jgi:CHAT domain